AHSPLLTVDVAARRSCARATRTSSTPRTRHGPCPTLRPALRDNRRMVRATPRRATPGTAVRRPARRPRPVVLVRGLAVALAALSLSSPIACAGGGDRGGHHGDGRRGAGTS